MTSSWAEDLPVDKIVTIGPNTYKIRVAGEEHLHDAGEVAKQRANEFCASMKQSVVEKYRTWDLGYGFTLTWSCLPPQQH